MEHATTRLKAWSLMGAIPLVLIASLPLLAVVAFVLRPLVLLAGATALLAAVLLWMLSRRFRAWLEVQGGPEPCYRGLRIAPDLEFHPSHSWVLMNDAIVVGADDLIQATLGPVKEVELPRSGCRVRRGERLFRLRSIGRSADVYAPVSGMVLATNDALHGHPELVNKHPFGRGWVVRLRAEDFETERRLLLRGRRARRWFRRDVDSMIATLPAGVADPAAPGSVQVGQLHRGIDDAAWRRLAATLFEPSRPVTTGRTRR